MQVNNTNYFFKSNSNHRFDDYLDKKLVPHRTKTTAVNWWNPGWSHTLHCTIGLMYPNSQTASDAKIKSVAKQVIQNVPSSMQTKAVGYDISPNGWVYLKLSHNQDLKNFHQDYINQLGKLNLTPGAFSGNKFMAHVSIGKLKNGANKTAAMQELKSLYGKISKDPMPFILYDIELDKAINKKNHKMLQRDLPRADAGAIKTAHLKNKHIIHFQTAQKAAAFANKIHYYYGIKNKVVGTTQPTLLLMDSEFKRLKGHYQNVW